MFQLPKLDYDFAKMEPVIDEQTMKIHHGKHHQGYVDKLNKILEGKKEFEGKTIEELLRGLKDLPEQIQVGVRNSGGGHFNHSLFWKVMGGGGGDPKGELTEAIKRDFGSITDFKEKFSAAALGVFGSGWVWLSVGQGRLWICSTPNQDNCLMKEVVECGCNREGDGYPILGLDVWEHAYYLKYQNRRAEYVENFWKVVNWKQVGENYGTVK